MTKAEHQETTRRDYRCRFTDYCGIKLKEIPEDGTCIFIASLSDDHRNPSGIAHGGMISTMTDVYAGTIAYLHDVTGRNRLFVTQTAEIHYIRPIPGDSMIGVGRLIHAGRRTVLAKADVYDENNKLCATATYTLFYVEE